MKQVKVLKIVVASPSDVQAERDMIPAIVEELNKGIADERGVRLEVYRWETDAYPAFHPLGPQGQIDSCLRIEDCDLLIGIFWKRFGTPVLEANSGTEHEIRVALEACEKMGRPQLMIYFNQVSHEPQSQAEEVQWRRVLDFKQTLSQKVLWWEYNGKDKFPNFVRQHLTQFIRGDYSGRPLDELLEAYRDHLTRRVSTVRIFGEAETRPLEKVFVELNIIEEYERTFVADSSLRIINKLLRRRRNILKDEKKDGDKEAKKPKDGDEEKKTEKAKHLLKPEELLWNIKKAMIVGSPGCGKTTMLKYLTWKTLKAEKRFPIFLELKNITQEEFNAAKDNLAELLINKAITDTFDLSQTERDRFKSFLFEQLKAGQVAIFLDGLDEIAGAKFFTEFCRSIDAFIRVNLGSNDLLITTRTYAFTHFEELKKVEIAPLTLPQMDAFLAHYYGDAPFVSKLQRQLRHRRELRELGSIPFLLSVMAHLYRDTSKNEGEIVRDRLDLYHMIVHQLVVQLDREKNVERFHLADPDGALKRNFLKQLAYERLLIDEIREDAGRLVFTGDIIFRKAQQFCQTQNVESPNLLAADIKATPLLREIGSDTYAFAHLTLQEFLAASRLAEQKNCENFFCRAYFDPTVAEMEVLPITFGLAPNNIALYKALEQLPESLIFTKFRLCARGLAYNSQISDELLTKLSDRLQEFIFETKEENFPYFDSVILSFAEAQDGVLLKKLVEDISTQLDNSYNFFVRMMAATVLGMIGGHHAVEFLLKALQDEHIDVRASVIEALGQCGDESAVKELVKILQKERYNSVPCELAVIALGKIGGDRAIEALMLACQNNESYSGIQQQAADALGEIGSQRALDALIAVAKDEEGQIRPSYSVIKAIGNIGLDDTAAIKILLAAALGKYGYAESEAEEALIKIGSEQVIDACFEKLRANNRAEKCVTRILGKIGGERIVDRLLAFLRELHTEPYKCMDKANYTVKALIEIGGERVAAGLITVLKEGTIYGFVPDFIAENLPELACEKDIDDLLDILQMQEWYEVDYACECDHKKVPIHVIDALVKIGTERAKDDLLAVLNNEACQDVRWEAIKALSKIGDERAVDELLAALQSEGNNRLDVIKALGESASERAVDSLLATLNDPDEHVRWVTIEALGKIGSERAVDDLLAVFQSEDVFETLIYNKHRLIAEALEKIGGERIVSGLLAILQEKKFMNSEASRSAALTLGNIGSERAVDSLIVALQEGDTNMREIAAEALEKICSERSKQVVQALHVALKDENKNVCRHAVNALEKIGSEHATKVLLAVLKDRHQDMREHVVNALGKIGSEHAIKVLLTVLKDRDHDMRKHAFQTLIDIRGERVQEGLLGYLNYLDIDQRLILFNRIGDQRAVEGLLFILGRKNRWSLLIKIGIWIVARFIGERKVKGFPVGFFDADERIDAAVALGKISHEKLTRGLEMALSHKSYIVRKKTAQVIGYYTNDKQMLIKLQRLAKKDRSKKVRTAAREAAEKYANKLWYFES